MKIKSLFLTVLIAFSSSAYAQYFDSKNWNTTYQEIDGGGWSTIWAEYNPSTFKIDVRGADDQSATAFSIGYSQAFPLVADNPLFLEAGLGAQYTFYTEDENGTYEGYSAKAEETFNMWSLKLPVNLLYKFELGTNGFSLAPYAGLSLRYNISATLEEKVTIEGESAKEKLDLFKNSDMGGSDYTWNRFQIGWQVGMKAIVNKAFMIGIAYGGDFNEIADDIKLQAATVTIGICF